MTGADRPRRIAIVGAGPSGLFALQALAKADADLRVDVYDRLPTPFGLLRYGVAPDHTSIKSVAENLGAVLDLPQVRFRGLELTGVKRVATGFVVGLPLLLLEDMLYRHKLCLGLMIASAIA